MRYDYAVFIYVTLFKEGVVRPEPAWDCSQGHPQRAWVQRLFGS